MEAMALESLVAAVWRLDDCLTVVRHPIAVTRGYSDIDVVGIRADGLRVAECKARGPARRVNVESSTRAWSQWWDDSLKNVGILLNEAQRPAWLPPNEMLKSVEFHLVGNIWFVEHADRQAAEQRLGSALDKELPAGLKGKCRAHISPSGEFLTEAIRKMRENIVDEHWGKRTGDPLLDALRELIRYANPAPAGARGVGATIRERTREQLLAALFGPEAAEG